MTFASSAAPHEYSRRVLLAVCGLSPQVVTETIYALAAQADHPFVPTEVHLVTTDEGARRAELALLSSDLGWFHKLRRDYELPEMQFDRSHIHVISDRRGHPMMDIRTPEDNQAAADCLTEQVRLFTSDPNCALHVSIAGGRKTMGFYLGYALSLYGRSQDRLSHVLVSVPFESSWDFFYPTPYNRVLQTSDGTLADSAMAEITLAEIPFVCLRHGLPGALLQGAASFSDTVDAARLALTPPRMRLNLKALTVDAAGKVFAIPPAEMALLAVFARRRLQADGPIAAPAKGVPDPEWATRYLREYRAIVGDMADIESTERALRQGMDGEYFSARKSKLDKKLRAILGRAADVYRIQDGGSRPRRYSLALSPDAISIDNHLSGKE